MKWLLVLIFALGIFCSPAQAAYGGAVNVNNNSVGAASIASAQTSVGTSASLIVAARTGAPGTGRIAATFYNAGAVTVYLGPSGVTASTGFALAPGATFTFNSATAFYGITASGTATVSAMETY
jgi:hypothetical protein